MPLNKHLILRSTDKFSIIETSDIAQEKRAINQTTAEDCVTSDLPVLSLNRLFTISKSSTIANEENILWNYLERYGFVILTVQESSACGKILRDLKNAVENHFFPPSIPPKINNGQLNSGATVYISERGVPMYHLGYELCDDIREAFRVTGGSIDSQPWPKNDDLDNEVLSPREFWVRGMCLCRYVCDIALRVTLGYDPIKVRRSPGSNSSCWKTHDYCKREEGRLPDRPGDYSVMYAMHYFNNDNAMQNLVVDDQDDGTLVNVKTHVDPSLFVLEPYLADVEGLQVKATDSTTWMTVDGKDSIIRKSIPKDTCAMVLFVGKAFSHQAYERFRRKVCPTKHRVVAPAQPGQRRVVMIYEQKYEEYFPPPIMD